MKLNFGSEQAWDLVPDYLIALTLLLFHCTENKNHTLIKTNGAKLHIACTTLSFVSEQRQKAKQQGDVVTITNVAKYHNIFSKSGFSVNKRQSLSLVTMKKKLLLCGGGCISLPDLWKIQYQ